MSDFLAGGRAGRGRGSPGDDPRTRRALDRQTTSADLAYPLVLDPQGRITIALDPRGPLGLTPKGELFLRFAEGLEVAPGSPHTLRVKGSPTIVADSKGALRARSSTTEIRNTSDLEGKTLKRALNLLASLAGDFVKGPASSSDSAVPLWDGATGRLLKDSGTKISDTPGSPVNAVIPIAQAGTGTLHINFLALGTPDGTKFVRDDGVLATPAGGDADAIHDNVAAEIVLIPTKAVPIGTDLVVIEDSAAGFAKKSAALSTLTAAAASVGPQGPIGLQGIEGEEGEQGWPGARGETGSTGAAGAAGAAGSPGPPGLDGDPGEDGWPGAAGERGAPGLAGVPGTPGADGDPGEDGWPGPRGEIGSTGSTGAQGATGLQGEQGDEGERGWPGERGSTGATGSTGSQGPTGLEGEPGEDGWPGARGDVGPAGPRGSDGARGADGDDGDDELRFPVPSSSPALLHGATASQAGASGDAPTPLGGENFKTLLGSAVWSTLSAFIDGATVVGAGDRGAILYRGPSVWALRDPVGLGRFLRDNGAGSDPTYEFPTAPSIQVLTTGTTTYTPGSGKRTALVIGIGPGGGGGGTTGAGTPNAAGGAGGGAGQVFIALVTGLTGTYTVSIPTGGAGGAASANGSNGSGPTTFINGGTTYTADYGNGGNGMAAGTALEYSQAGAGGSGVTNALTANSGDPGMYGCRLDGDTASAGKGGSVGIFGGGGLARVAEGNGFDGEGFGAGGGGAVSVDATSHTGGAGAPGGMFILEFP